MQSRGQMAQSRTRMRAARLTQVGAVAGCFALATLLTCVETRAEEAVTQPSPQSRLEPREHVRNRAPLEASQEAAPDAADKHHDWSFSVTAKILAGVYFSEEERVEVSGFGGQLDFPLIGHMLELEVGAALLHSEHGNIVPVELMLAHVFDVSPLVQPYVAAGPTLCIGAHTVEPGAALTGGLNLWTRGHLGVHGEAIYAHVYGEHLAQEVTGGLGMSYRY